MDEQLLRHYLEATTLGFWQWQPHANDFQISSSLQSLLDLPAIHLLRDWLDYIHPDDVPPLRAAVHRSLAQGGNFQLEVQLRLPDGNYLNTLCQGMASPDGTSGRTVMATHVDRGESQRVESALEGAFRRTAGVIGVDFMRALVKELAAVLKVKYAFASEIMPGNRNRAHTLALCVDGEIVDNMEYDLSGTPCANVLHRTLCHYPCDIQRLFPEDVTLVDMAAESYMGAPVFSADGEPLGLVSVIDVQPLSSSPLAKALLSIFAARAGTELERTRSEERVQQLNQELENRVQRRTEELQRANQEIEAFSYSVSHDLRAPIRRIHNFANILSDDYADHLPSEGRDYLSRIMRAATNMSELIDAMLHLARLSQQEMRPTVFDLVSMVRTIVSQGNLGDNATQVELRLPPHLRVKADATLLSVAVENLLRNAYKFSAKTPHPVVEIGMQKHEGVVTYSVRDNGAGFDMRYADKLFKTFQRLHDDQTFEGTGIGLAVVKQVIDRHGGRVWAEGETGKGATFYFTLGPDNQIS
ncbi:PAS domain-containing sensor histidine kinase [Chitinivorax sp. B]|uniref:PAS domain-containing sensor histidine kinase n=1 Tax=Chitinivorax sp. B TaxID=2502235 RepID=UPI0010F8D90A|nr:PAS domain-containing sensor histidine kinase [Chitinivorax sp. B]